MQYERASASERRYLPPAVAVSVVAFALRPPAEAEQAPPAGANADPETGSPTIWLPLVRRTRAPFLGQWALPGGPTEWDETLADTALRTLRAAAGREPGHLEQLFSFGGVERSAEAQRLVTIAYWALYGEHELDALPETASPDSASHAPASPQPASSQPASPQPGPRDSAQQARRWDDPLPPVQLRDSVGFEARADEALAQPAGENVAWFSVDRLPPLAFDHAEIIEHALSRLRAKTEYAAVAHRFLGPEFTLGRLRAVTEAVLGQPVDPANFRRQALARGGLVDTGKLESGGAHRPARLYRFSEAVADEDATRSSQPAKQAPPPSDPQASPTQHSTTTNARNSE